MRRMRTVLPALTVLLLATAPTGAEPGARTTVGREGAHAAAVTRAVGGRTLYTIDGEGALVATDLDRGARKAIGGADFADARRLFADGKRLLLLSHEGSLFDVSLTTGARTPIGKAGSWRDTMGAALLGGTLYTSEVNGGLYATDLGKGTWTQVGSTDFADVVALFPAGDHLVGLETSGSLVAIARADGAWQPRGEARAWARTRASASTDGTLYTVDRSGQLFRTVLATGARRALGAPTLTDVVAIWAPGGDAIYALDAGGTLSSVALQ